MILFVRKRQIYAAILILLIVFASFFGLFGEKKSASCSAQLVFPMYQVVIDPGHGGEDGGAVSASGTEESQLNLEIGERLFDLMRFTGQSTLMTRCRDCALDHGEPTIRQRKAADLRARAAIVNNREDRILLSIHQNSLPSSTATHGAQAFWNKRSGARNLAEKIQSCLNASINTHRPKSARQISTGVYLLEHVTAPGVLIECGFLSNPEEEKKLQESFHQRKLTVAIAAGYLQWLLNED